MGKNGCSAREGLGTDQETLELLSQAAKYGYDLFKSYGTTVRIPVNRCHDNVQASVYQYTPVVPAVPGGSPSFVQKPTTRKHAHVSPLIGVYINSDHGIFAARNYADVRFMFKLRILRIEGSGADAERGRA